MIYMGLIAIILGLISILITIMYMKFNNKVVKQLKYIRNKCINTKKTEQEIKIIKLFNSLQKQSKLSFVKIKNIVLDYHNNQELLLGEEEVNNLEKLGEVEEVGEVEEEDTRVVQEKFHNFSNDKTYKNSKFLYTSNKSRGYSKNINIEENLKKILDINKVKELSSILGNYRGLFDRTLNRIKTITESDTDTDSKKKFKGLLSYKNKPLTCSKKNLKDLENIKLPFQKLQFCQQQINGKKYCFRIPKKSLCSKGKIVYDTKNCDFY